MLYRRLNKEPSDKWAYQTACVEAAGLSLKGTPLRGMIYLQVETCKESSHQSMSLAPTGYFFHLRKKLTPHQSLLQRQVTWPPPAESSTLWRTPDPFHSAHLSYGSMWVSRYLFRMGYKSPWGTIYGVQVRSKVLHPVTTIPKQVYFKASTKLLFFVCGPFVSLWCFWSAFKALKLAQSYIPTVFLVSLLLEKKWMHRELLQWSPYWQILHIYECILTFINMDTAYMHINKLYTKYISLL